jgi:hypothetical protein
MTTDEAMDLALEALEVNNQAWKSLADSGDAGFWEAEEQPFYELSVKAITAIKKVRALDKKAENARELGLDYEPVLKDNSNYRYDPPVAEPVAWNTGVLPLYPEMKDGETISVEYTTPPAQPAPVQEPLPPDDESICEDWISASDSDGVAYDGPSFERGYKLGQIAERDAVRPRPEIRGVRSEFEAMFATPPAQPSPVQEPVAFFDWYDNAHWGNEDFKEGCHRSWNAAIKYTTPPNVATPLAAQRQWVGLSGEDKKIIRDNVGYDQFMTAGEYAHLVQEATEAKLKERNV